MDSRGSPGLAEDPAGHTELLAERAGIAISHIREARAYTTARLEEIRAAFRADELPDTVSICVFGSSALVALIHGRVELSQASRTNRAVR